MKHSSLRNPLAKVRGWGSAHEGTSHFFWQRITALALVPLTLWFVQALMHLAFSPNPRELVLWLAVGWHAVLLILLLAALFYHAKLGMQVIIEDYIHCPIMKFTALLLNMFILYGFAACCMLAVLKLHLSGGAA